MYACYMYINLSIVLTLNSLNRTFKRTEITFITYLRFDLIYFFLPHLLIIKTFVINALLFPRFLLYLSCSRIIMLNWEIMLFKKKLKHLKLHQKNTWYTLISIKLKKQNRKLKITRYFFSILFLFNFIIFLGEP